MWSNRVIYVFAYLTGKRKQMLAQFISWIKITFAGHFFLWRNRHEQQDAAAATAATSYGALGSVRTFLHRTILSSWQTEWTTNCEWWNHPRRREILSQRRKEGGGHCHTATDGSCAPHTWSFFRGEPAPFCCICGAKLTASHIPVDCPRYAVCTILTGRYQKWLVMTDEAFRMCWF